MGEELLGGGPLKRRLRFLLLTLLAISPSHGYELGKRIEALTLGSVKAGPGSIYPVLRELRREGLVSEELIVEGGRAKKVYKLTEKGVTALREELTVMRELLANLLSLVDEALESLRSPRNGGDCVFEKSILERLDSLKRVIERYMSEVRTRLSSCINSGE